MMKARSVVYIPILFLVLAVVYGFGGGSKYPGGSPGGYTGSPDDGKTCTQCHGGSAAPVLGWISSNVPVQGYIPGETYTITITVTGAGDKGFEVSPQSMDGALLGTLIDASGVHLVNGNKAVTQDNSSSANPKVWEFQWIAPEAGTGPVTFYGAFTLNKPVTKLCTLVIQEDQSVGIEDPVSFLAEIFPNPATNLINIAFYAPEAGIIEIRLVSAGGSSVDLPGPGMVERGENKLSIKLPGGTASGIYFLYLRIGDKTSTKQIIVR